MVPSYTNVFLELHLLFYYNSQHILIVTLMRFFVIFLYILYTYCS